MEERHGEVTLLGNPVTLVGKSLATGSVVPDVELVDGELAARKLSEFKGKVCVLLSVPSLDTPVCDTETRRFNEEAAGLGDDVMVCAVSMDLPFAQKRWCGAAGVENVLTLSDHREAAFGEACGLLIKEVRLLARAVMVLDREGRVSYQQLVSEVADEPDYAAALDAVKAIR